MVTEPWCYNFDNMHRILMKNLGHSEMSPEPGRASADEELVELLHDQCAQDVSWELSLHLFRSEESANLFFMNDTSPIEI